MASLVPHYITAFDKGFINNKKPFLNPDEAWTVLENAYCFRERLLKREGLLLLGRLRRVFTSVSIGNTGASPWSFNIFSSVTPAITEPEAQIQPATVTITLAAGPIIFTDQGNGTLSSLTPGNSGTINYTTGDVVLTHTAGAGVAATISFAYYPTLPGMGTLTREIASLNSEQTIWFDTRYAYIRNAGQFQEFIPGTTWAGTNSDFFWGYNYRGANPQDKLFFVTNFVNDAADPIRYTDGLTWTSFNPFITQATPPNPATDLKLYQARIIIAYYNRLLVFNTWEGTDSGGYASAVNYQNRCRFCSRFESPIAADSWRTDIFGKGGVIDAPTNEAIIGVMFVRNTLIVQFEETTWQLTYIGEYGLPFVWERVSADYGSESTFSSVLYENQMLSIGDKAIIASNSTGSQRIDLDIPEEIFDFQYANNGALRVWGVRDYERELIFWNYPDVNTLAAETPPVTLTFPNKVLVYNYRNNTWAIFRDNVTTFGTYYLQNDDTVTWDSLNITWDDPNVTWGDPQFNLNFDAVVSQNQQGFVHQYGYVLPDQASLTIESIDLTANPITITSVNHNLQDDEIISLSGLIFVNSSTFAPLTTNLNGQIFKVTVIDPDTISLSQWSFITNDYSDDTTEWNPIPTPDASIALYIGGGMITLYPKLNVQTKDLNIFQEKGLLTKLSYIDFLLEPVDNGAFTVNLLLNASVGNPSSAVANEIVGNANVALDTSYPFYTPGSDYAWFRFFATLSAQFFRIGMTYNDALMNTALTHASPFTLYAITAYVRPGGKTLYS